MVAVLGLVAALGSPAAGNGARIVFCAGTELTGAFAAIPGSAGAGNISYRLTLRNVSARSCAVSGLPEGVLLDRSGAALPTRVRAAFPGSLTALLVRLAPGKAAHATARFSPDVPGPGEPAPRLCEPLASFFRVSARGGGTTTVKLRPATPACEHGRLFFSAYGH